MGGRRSSAIAAMTGVDEVKGVERCDVAGVHGDIPVRTAPGRRGGGRAVECLEERPGGERALRIRETDDDADGERDRKQ